MVNEKKLKAVIAYLAERTHPGKVKLFKLLYFADFTAYSERGQSITSETYVHFPMGPVPQALYHDLREGHNTYVDMEFTTSGMPFPTQLMRPKPDVDLLVLSAEEKAILDRVIERYGPLSGASLREITHREIPYITTKPGEEIPYRLSLYRAAQKPTSEEIQRFTANTEFMHTLRQSLRELEQTNEPDHQVE